MMDEDWTPVEPINYVPPLAEVLSRLKGTQWTVAFYDDGAPPRAPWLWLQSGNTTDDYELRKIVSLDGWT